MSHYFQVFVPSCLRGSVPLNFLLIVFHQRDEPAEQVRCVMRAGRGLGVILHAERAQVGGAQALAAAVVQVCVRHFHARWQRLVIYREAVVVARNLHPPGIAEAHRLVAAVVAEAQLVGAAAQRQTQDLVAEADAEQRLLAQQAAHRVDRVGHGGGVAGAVREKNAVGVEREHLGGGRAGRHHRHAAALVGHQAQDVALHAEIVGDNMQGMGARGWGLGITSTSPCPPAPSP